MKNEIISIVVMINVCVKWMNAGERVMRGDKNSTGALPEHGSDNVNGNSKWKLK